MSNYNKSPITDHAMTENDIIDWEGAKIIDKEQNKRTRQLKEAIWIRKTKIPMNRDEGYLPCTLMSFFISTEEVDV